MSYRLHNREPLRSPEHLESVRSLNRTKVLAAIDRLARSGQPFSKKEVLQEAGIYLHGTTAGNYINDRPELLSVYQAAMQTLGVGL